MLLLRGVLFAILIPGTVVVLLPFWIVSRARATPSGSSILGVIGISFIIAGASTLVWCIWDFGRRGRGTLAPIDPPTRLVVRGLYRYVRNPMYLGALLTLAGQCALFASAELLLYMVAWFACVHLFVVLYEEPSLRRRFGSSYEQYYQEVHRWLPTGAGIRNLKSET